MNRRPVNGAPPGYGEPSPTYAQSTAGESTYSSNLSGNNSSMRLLPHPNEPEFRPYVPSSLESERNPRPRARYPPQPRVSSTSISPARVVLDRSIPKRKPVVPSLHVHWRDQAKKTSPFSSSLISSSLDEAQATLSQSSSTRATVNGSQVNGDAPKFRARVTLRRTYADKPTPYRARAMPERYHRPTASSVQTSRPNSSLGHAPSIAPPGATRHVSPERSPIRPSTPSRDDWTRAPPSSVSYEPAELNGSPRPGTPSSKFGSPRRPLPPAPLFAAGAPKVSDETAIPMPDEDVFGPGGIIEPDADPRMSMRSHISYQSEKTFTDELEPAIHEKADMYGPAPQGPQDRRGLREAQMIKKDVRLINGQLILEVKIPTILHSFLPRRDDREFTHLRYTAVTCDPDDFVLDGYKLRQNIGSTMRETELFICVTMYNENEVDFTRTMHGIMRNIAHFCSRSKSRTWGKDGWQKIVVCIMADGRRKVNPRTLNALAAMGVYQEGIAKNVVNKNEVTAHVYEYTTQVSLDESLKFKGAEKGIVPCQMIFCLKEKNQKKLNSHRWFFNAFGRALTPNVCILLDVGTKPESKALYHLWKAFDQDSNVAGAAGEIKAGTGKAWLGLLNPLVASQNFEYKMSNILDKPLESVFGYITVLPGALSAYRYYALQNDPSGHGPLSQYFKGETLHGHTADVFTANMYLAEDRILCWELVAKRSEQWVLKFVKSAVGETDVPGDVPEFISQRRRWLNGAFFAAVYSLTHFRQIWQTDHSMARKVLLHVEFVYQFISLLFTFFSLANFYLTFFFIAGSLADPKIDPFGHNIGRYIFVVLRYTCVLLICLQFILSMGNRPQGAKRMFFTTMVTYSIIMAYTTFAALYIVIMQLKHHTLEAVAPDKSPYSLGNNVFTNLIVSTVSTVGLYFLMSFLYLDPWHMFTSSAQYFALLPSYICTLQVYAFCNTHDVTWGTKGDNILHTDLGAATAKQTPTGVDVVEVSMPSEQLDIDSAYDVALRNLRDRLAVAVPPLPEAQAQEDYYRAVRTYMVAVWMVANAVLAMAVSEGYALERGVADNVYLKILLWSVAGLAVFRAIGSSAFGVLNVVQAVVEGRFRESLSRVLGFEGDKGDNRSEGTRTGGKWGWGGSSRGSGIGSGTTGTGTGTGSSGIASSASWRSGWSRVKSSLSWRS